jgi:hypothetical protein
MDALKSVSLNLDLEKEENTYLGTGDVRSKASRFKVKGYRPSS